MDIRTKDLAPLGFEGSGVFESWWHHFYYLEVPKKKAVYIWDNLDHELSHFDLDDKQWRSFKRGRLALVPLGCCCVTGRKYIEDPDIDYKGDMDKIFETKQTFLEFLKKTCME